MTLVRATERQLYGSTLPPLPVGLTPTAALKHVGLDWDVHQLPLATGADLDLVCDGCEHTGVLHRVPGWVANTRSDTGAVLSVTRSTYTPIQNRDAFWLADELVHGGCTVDAIGPLDPDGRRSFASLRLPAHARVAGEDLQPMLFVLNSHDGTTSFRLALKHLRIDCTNQLPSVWRTAPVAIRHTRHAHMAIESARKVLGLAMTAERRNSARLAELATVRCSNGAFERIVQNMYPLADDASKRTQNHHDRLMAGHATLWQAEHNSQIKGSAYGAYNVMVEWIDWGRRGAQNDQRFARSFAADHLKHEAFRNVCSWLDIPASQLEEAMSRVP